ncbi:MAG: hypothetical protein LIO76_00070 [Clostridiales bacterium]|nr:hypothetical protein [Clostridiales bacterium]
MLILMVIAGLLCCGYVAAVYSDNATVTKIAVFAFAGWLFSHIIVSGLLFWAEAYSVNRCALCCMLLWGLAALICIIRRKKASVSFHLKKEIPVFIVVLCAIPLVMSKNEYFGMGQDEGVYQTQALLFMNGYNDVNLDMSSWYATEDEDEIARLEEATSSSNLIGYYRLASRWNLPGIKAKHVTDENEGVLHGIPTFPALLALWGSMFGMENMQGINTAIYICVIFLIFYICENMSVHLMGKIISMVIYAISPLVIWSNKSALTETGFTLIFMCFLYFILQLRKEEHEIKYALGSAFCVGTLSFYHVSAFVFMPFFVLIYLGLWYFCRKRACLAAMILSTLEYLAGFWMMYTVATSYTSDNYKVIYYGFIGHDTICQVVTVTCAAVVLIGLLLLLLVRKPLPVLRIPASGCAAFVKILCVALACLALYRCHRKSSMMIRQLPNVTLGALLIVCGVVVPLIVYLTVFFSTKWWLENYDRIMLLTFFVYCVLIYSSLFRPWIKHYYYYARYLTMFVPLLAIMGGALLDRAVKWQGILSVAVSALILLPYDWCLLTQIDDTRIEWSTLKEIAAELDPGDSIIIAKDSLFQYFYFPLIAMTDADIYPAYEDDLSDQIASLSESGGDVYVLGGNDDTVEAEEADLVLVKTIVNQCSQDTNAAKDDFRNPNHSNLLQLPFTFYQYTNTYALYMAE